MDNIFVGENPQQSNVAAELAQHTPRTSHTLLETPPVGGQATTKVLVLRPSHGTVGTELGKTKTPENKTGKRDELRP